MGPVTIRAARAADVPAIVALVTEVLTEHGLQFGEGSPTDDELRDLPRSYDERGGAFWVAEADATVIGTCGVFPVRAATLELRKMYLRPAARGRRVGQQLLDLAIAWARGQGATRMVLDTTERMTRAIAFYEANGFVRDDAEKRGARCSRGYARAL